MRKENYRGVIFLVGDKTTSSDATAGYRSPKTAIFGHLWKGVTDRPTDLQTDPLIEMQLHLKINKHDRRGWDARLMYFFYTCGLTDRLKDIRTYPHIEMPWRI